MQDCGSDCLFQKSSSSRLSGRCAWNAESCVRTNGIPGLRNAARQASMRRRWSAIYPSGSPELEHPWYQMAPPTFIAVSGAIIAL